MNVADLKDQTNKRLTLNLLIQGAAAHTFISASHLVRDELEQLRPGLTLLYDRFSIGGQLNYCIGEMWLLFGRPNRFWGFSPWPQRPFRSHGLMSRFGNSLVREEIKHLKKLARTKNVISTPFFHWFQFMRLVFKVCDVEKGIERELEKLAVTAVSQIWDIDPQRMSGTISRDVEFGNLQTPQTMLGRIIRTGAIGYGGVRKDPTGFTVVAKAWVFPLVIHELVKGTVELICLHGLNKLPDDVYEAVTAEADQLEYEAWMLQAGPAMWRRLLAVAPRDRHISKVIMHLAKLDPKPLDDLMCTIIEHPERAKRQLETSF